MRNCGLDEAQAGIKIGMRNKNNLRYEDDTTLMAQSKEELKSCLMKVKVESEKAALKLNIQKTVIMASYPNFEQVLCSMSGSNCCFLTYIQVSQGQVMWVGIPTSSRISQFVVIHTKASVQSLRQK